MIDCKVSKSHKSRHFKLNTPPANEIDNCKFNKGGWQETREMGDEQMCTKCFTWEKKMWKRKYGGMRLRLLLILNELMPVIYTI